MRHKIQNKMRLSHPADAFLPLSLLLATILGRNDAAFDLFAAMWLSRLCALASASGLRSAFARQPSVRYVQGSVALALALQPVGASIALALFPLLRPSSGALPWLACGLLLNIEHVFYEYLYAVGDGNSATLCRGITALMALTGLLLSPPTAASQDFVGLKWPLVTTGIAALVALVISAFMGGRLRPRLSAELFRVAPASMLQTALYPALGIALTLFAGLNVHSFMPFFVGLAVFELCRAPFRRTAAESAPMNRALLIACVAALLCALPFALGWIAAESPSVRDIPYACGAVILAAVCGVMMYGNVDMKRNRDQ